MTSWSPGRKGHVTLLCVVAAALFLVLALCANGMDVIFNSL